MRAAIQSGYGTSAVLSTGWLERPTIGESEALVEVRAAGLDRGTWHLMTGTPYAVRLAIGLRSPRRPVPGLDLSGVVVAIGAKVTRVRVGDEVFGIGKGSFAQFAAAREDKLAHKPAALSFEQAAAVPISGLTALAAVVDKGHIADGERVLITGASGGVGTFAVQLAKAQGAHVTALCSGAKADLVTALGADQVIDYRSPEGSSLNGPFDVIIDIGGNRAVTELRRSLTPQGRLVIVGGEGSSNWSTGVNRQLGAMARNPFVRHDLSMVVASEKASELERLIPYLDAGTVVPFVDQVFALDDVRAAMDRLDAGQARGKIVLIPPALEDDAPTGDNEGHSSSDIIE